MSRWSRLGALAAALLLAVAAWGTALRAWAFCFTNWAEYDDQGYFMLAVKHVLDGRAPYDEFAFLHGPAFFGWRWLLHGVGPFPLTIDGVRIATVCTWTLVSALGAAFAGGSATRGTRLACAVIVLASCGQFLAALSGEPGHSQELVLLAGAITCACAPRFACASAERTAVALGLAAGVVVATKINVGALFVVGALVHLGARGVFAAGGRVLDATVLLALMALPFVQLHGDLASGWARESAAANALALAGLWLFRKPDAPAGKLSVAGRFVLAACAGYAVCLAFVLARGSSVGGVFQSTVLDALRVPGILHMFEGWAPGAFLAAVAGFTLACALRAAPEPVQRTWGPRLAIVARLGFVVAWARYTEVGSFAFVSYVPPLLPLALFPLRGDDARTPAAWHVVACLATAGALQTYPVVGTQSAIAGFPCFLLAVVLLADLAAFVFGAARSRTRERVAAASLLAASLLVAIPAVRDGWNTYVSWSGSIWKLGLPGSTRLAMKPAPTLRTRWLARNLEAHSSRFMAGWSTNAFYFWTTREPPTLDVVTHAWQLVPPERQRGIIAALEREPAPFVAMRTGLDDEPEQRDEPFVAWVREHCRLVASWRGFELHVPRAAPEVPLLDCAWAADGTFGTSLPESLRAEAARPERCVYVVAVPAAARERDIAALRASDPRRIADALGTDCGPEPLRLTVHDEHGTLLLGGGTALSSARLGERVYVTSDRASIARARPVLDTFAFVVAGEPDPIAQVPIVERPAR